MLDLQQEAAQEVFAKMVKTADVLISNVREPALSKRRTMSRLKHTNLTLYGLALPPLVPMAPMPDVPGSISSRRAIRAFWL